MLVLALSLVSLLSFGRPAPGGQPPPQLTVEVTGMESTEGTVQVAIFDSPDQFLEQPCRQGVIRSLTPDTVRIQFALPAGNYAIAVYHDANENQELDKNFFGIPKEVYGFSNNQRGGSLGPPSFQDAAISLDRASQTIRVTLR